MIVVDGSVWIDHLKNRLTAQVIKLRDIIGSAASLILVGDLVMTEVLQELSSEREAERVERAFSRFRIAPMVGEQVAVKAASNYRSLRASGITIRRTIDLLIGTYCIEHNLPLLHAERDFLPMERHLGLRSVLTLQ